jgi:MurNAc alpha-1-phosphate uridylyltransferase
MKAMILAAGRGERMRPLTDVTPKPLLKVRGKALIVHQVEKLAQCGFTEIVVNVAHLGGQIMEALGDGSQWGVSIAYSDEREAGALESAGGIVKALPLLGDGPFLVVNADVWCDYDFNSEFDLKGASAHLLLVPNPGHNPQGDFGLVEGRLTNDRRYTFAGIGYYAPELFETVPCGRAALAPLLRSAIEAGQVSGELHEGEWVDVGTPERLEQLNERVSR